MKVTKENLENQELSITVEVPAEDWNKAVKQAVTRISHRVNIPGFRKGKAPRHIVEAAVGVEAILEDAYENYAPEAFEKVLKDEGIELGAYPKFERVTMEKEKPLVFKAKVVPKPAVALGDYLGLNIEQKPVEISDEEVDSYLNRMLERKAQLVEAEKDAKAAKGDLVMLDYTGYVDDEAFEGGEGKDYPLTLGSGTFIPGFEDQLIGIKAGEARDVKVTFPEAYHSEKLAGREAIFKCKVNKIKHHLLPAADDEFAKANSTFQTIGELKADIRKNLERTAAAKAKQEYDEAVIAKATENATVDVPLQMVEDRITEMMQTMSNRLASQGMQFERYLQYAGSDIAKLREDYRETALKSVQTDLVLEEIAKKEDIKVTAEDIEAEIQSMATAYSTTAAQVKKIIRDQGTYAGLVSSIGRRKTARFVIDKAAKKD